MLIAHRCVPTVQAAILACRVAQCGQIYVAKAHIENKVRPWYAKYALWEPGASPVG